MKEKTMKKLDVSEMKKVLGGEDTDDTTVIEDPEYAIKPVYFKPGKTLR